MLISILLIKGKRRSQSGRLPAYSALLRTVPCKLHYLAVRSGSGVMAQKLTLRHSTDIRMWSTRLRLSAISFGMLLRRGSSFGTAQKTWTKLNLLKALTPNLLTNSIPTAIVCTLLEKTKLWQDILMTTKSKNTLWMLAPKLFQLMKTLWSFWLSKMKLQFSTQRIYSLNSQENCRSKEVP